VAWATSGLVEVETAGPVCAIRVGTITALVLPDRGGPSTSTARSVREYRVCPSGRCPRYTPPPRISAVRRTCASRSPPPGRDGRTDQRGVNRRRTEASRARFAGLASATQIRISSTISAGMIASMWR